MAAWLRATPLLIIILIPLAPPGLLPALIAFSTPVFAALPILALGSCSGSPAITSVRPVAGAPRLAFVLILSGIALLVGARSFAPVALRAVTPLAL
jgi:hypothetical protein